MGYKLLGFTVWQGANWYLRRRLRGARRVFALGGLTAVVAAGVLAGKRARSG